MNRRLEVVAAARGGWFTRPDALAAGYSDSQLQQRVRSGQWLRLSFNSYVDPAGRRIGRVDFLLAGVLVIEFDGALKYAAGADVVLAEKWREDRLRERGYGVLRLGWKDLNHPDDTAARIWHALARHAPRSRDKQ